MKQSEQVLEWMAEGRAEGEIKGRIEGKRQSLLRLLNRRFSTSAPSELIDRIQAMTNEESLDHWLDAVGTAASLEDFQRIVERNGA
jgi:predicted transposase YdaD